MKKDKRILKKNVILRAYHDDIVFEKHRFKNVLIQIPPVFVFEKLRYCQGLVRTLGQNVLKKLRFQISPA